MALAYDPELVVIGGIVGLADGSYLEVIREHLDRLTLYAVNLTRATSGEHAVVRGASLHAVETIENTRFP